MSRTYRLRQDKETPVTLDLFQAAERRVYTVSSLTREIRDHLETGYPDLWLEGEVSNLHRPASGHAYFTLKDEKAQIRAVLFKMVRARLRFELEDGLQVLVRGRLSVYEPRGEYQVVVEHVEPRGVGPLELAFQQICERLQREGLFDEERKRPLPSLPMRVGVVTSITGAAVRDILRILFDRCPQVRVLIAPVRVQGEGAAREIAEAIGHMNEQDDVDVLIVGRGGGSLEDLWAFNEETVARAIASSRIPVISAVGHEIDVTVADLVADVRAPTPTAAAEMAVPRTADLEARVRELDARIASRVGAQIQDHRRRLAALLQRRPFRRPLDGIRDCQRRLDDLTDRLGGGVRRGVQEKARTLRSLTRQLATAAPTATVARLRTRTEGLREALFRSVEHRTRLLRERFTALAHRLESSSPLSILGRGYAVCRRLPGLQVVREAGAVSTGEEVRVDLGRGHLLCDVQEVHAKEGILEEGA